MGYEDLDLNEVKPQEEEDINQTLANKIESYYKQDIADKLLRAYSWDEAIRFYDGDHHIEYNVSTNRFQQVITSRNNDFIPRPITNYILPVVRTIVSQLTKQKPEAKVRPNSQDPRDIASAKVGDLVLDVKFEELREDEKTQEKAYWGVITGTVFKKIYWDETTNKVLKLPKKTEPAPQIQGENERLTPTIDNTAEQSISDIEKVPPNQTPEIPATVSTDIQQTQEFEEFPVGDVNTSVIPPFNMAYPLSARSPLEAEWIMEYSIQKIDWIKQQYSQTGDGYTGLAEQVTEEKDLSTILQLEYRLRTLTGRRSGGHYATGSAGYVDIKNSAVLKEYYGRPTREYPKGRMIVVANGKTLYSGDSPYYDENVEDSWNPYVEWRFEIVPGRCWGKSHVDELIPINRRINAIDALIILNRRTMAIPQWLLPKGCGIPNGYINGRPGLNINYRPVGANGAKPEKVQPSSLPNQVFEERVQAVDDIKRIGMTNDVLEGSNPQGVKTAYQLEQLLENSLASLGAIFQRWEKSFEREETKKLLLISKRYKEPRVDLGKKLKALNKDITDIELEMFLGDDLRDNVSVRVEMGSSIPRSQAGENAVLREMVQNGILDVVGSAVNKRELLDKMGIKGFDYDKSPDIKRAQWENSIIEAGDMNNLIVGQAQPQIDPMTGQPAVDPMTGMPAMTPAPTTLELDDHETHIVIHSARMKDMNVPPDIRQKYLTHIEEHLQHLRTGIQAQQGTGIAGQQPTPQQNINKQAATEQVMGGQQ